VAIEAARALLAGLLYAGATLAALPPVSLWWLGLAAPLPVCWAAWSSSRIRTAALAIGIGTLPLWIVHHAWVASISAAGVAPLVMYLAAWPVLLAWMIWCARRSGISGAIGVPTVWVAVEMLRGQVVMGGYAWFLAGHPLIESPVLSRPAAVGGIPLVSWLVVAMSGIAVGARTGGPRWPGWAVGGCVAAGFGLGLVLPGPRADGSIRVGLVQTNVPQDNRSVWTLEQRVADFERFEALTLQAAAAEPDLIIWPETMFPGPALDSTGAAELEAAGWGELNAFRDRLLAIQTGTGASMLIGATTMHGLRIEGEGADEAIRSDGVFNSVYAVFDGAVAQERYDKLRPMPFGETLPYVNSVPWLRGLVLRIGLGASGMDFGLDAGSAPRPLEVPTRGPTPVRVATPICFESSMAPTVRRIVNAGDGVDLLVVMTNDGWFGGFDPGRAMHLLQARWRCVEQGLSMARCANTGISAVIDARGRIVAGLEARRDGVVVAEVALGGVATPYRAVGEVWGWVCLVGALGMVFVGVRRGGRAEVEVVTDG
jgi:apolipoprotein N-acyltransferase